MTENEYKEFCKGVYEDLEQEGTLDCVDYVAKNILASDDRVKEYLKSNGVSDNNIEERLTDDIIGGRF